MLCCSGEMRHRNMGLSSATSRKLEVREAFTQIRTLCQSHVAPALRASAIGASSGALKEVAASSTLRGSPSCFHALLLRRNAPSQYGAEFGDLKEAGSSRSLHADEEALPIPCCSGASRLRNRRQLWGSHATCSQRYLVRFATLLPCSVAPALCAFAIGVGVWGSLEAWMSKGLERAQGVSPIP